LIVRRLRAIGVRTIEVGSEFLGYRIEELIGQGGMGVVYRAHDLRLKRTVALKLIAPELALDERFRERFSRESELAMSLEHPNVVPIHDAGDVGDRLYLAMRYVEGTDLRSLLRAEGALDPARALAICSQIAAALQAAHARGLVHRDVKPANVLLDEGEHAYLADFGLTRQLDEHRVRAGEHRSLGTPSYLAPEQIEGKAVDGRADVYSLGCLFYECLTGYPPFPRDSLLAVAWAHLEEAPPSASDHKPGLPAAIDAVIRKAMAKEPAHRYPTCAAFIAAAEEALTPRQPSIFGRRRLAVWSAAAIFVGLGAVLSMVFIGRSGETAAPAVLVRANTLVRIDPATNTLSSVVNVGQRPVATAVGGRSVWVYSREAGTVSEIDPRTNRVVHTTWPAQPLDIGSIAGPVLAADAAGAWIVGLSGGKSVLTRIYRGGRGTREYSLDRGSAEVAVGPVAVAVGEDAVWVLRRATRQMDLLRVDPASGDVTARTHFSRTSLVDGLAVGAGAVWALDSTRAILYRIDARSAAVTRRRDLGDRATRPVVGLGSVWVYVTDFGGESLLTRIDPRTLDTDGDYVSPEWGHFALGYDSTWWYDVPTGTVARFNGFLVAATIRVAGAPLAGGRCMTSIATGAGGVWVTVAARPFTGACISAITR
jgi:DNA-binding beta-propeller fold protein YncE